MATVQWFLRAKYFDYFLCKIYKEFFCLIKLLVIYHFLYKSFSSFKILDLNLLYKTVPRLCNPESLPKTSGKGIDFRLRKLCITIRK